MNYPQGYWLNEDSRTILSRDYLQPGVTPEQRIREVSETAENILGIKGFADEFEQYMLNGWISLSSPVWANFGNSRGLPISCNGSYVEDDMTGIILKNAEIGEMTKNGSGTSAYFGDIRPRGTPIKKSGGVADGPVHYMELFSSMTNIVSQSSVRRGHCAAYLPVDHPDVEEFLQIREEGNHIQNLSLGVTVSDEWMESMIAGDKEKRRIWMRIIRKRFETGFPYVFFSDTVNRNTVDVYRDKGMRIHASNMCAEIALPSSVDESFVCCLASLNILHYEDWKDTGLVRAMTFFLDAVMEEYIQKTANMRLMENANRFARRHRAIGIGTLGWHSFLQSKTIPFESTKARELNIEVHKTVYERSYAASAELAKLLGEPEVLVGYGRRNTTLMAIAPTTSSSAILGQVSPSIEPLNSNYFTKDLQKGKFTYRNPFLAELLDSYAKNTKEIWNSILLAGGSVQHLEFLSEREKATFKTFGEISQMEIIVQASDRQKWLDQSQSVNVMVHPDTPLKEINLLMIEAWKLEVKTLYYQRSANKAQELSRSILTCTSCEV